jgi:GT2 family glycosyltransferase
MFSVIIPTCDRNDLLALCLTRLKDRVQNADISYEVIVSDDSRSNTSRKFIEEQFSWVKWVEGPKRGPAANRNHGAANANGDWFIFIDDDCLPNAEIINEYKKAIAEYPDFLAFEGRIYVNESQTSFLQEAPLNTTGGCFWSCNICIKRKLFQQLNGFDENFPFAAMEDVDMFIRLKNITDKYMFLSNAAVLHPYRKNKQLYKTILKRYQSQLYFISKHPEQKEVMGAAFYFRSFGLFFKSTLKNAWRFRFSGFGRKICCDFLQLYFGFRAMFKMDREYN